jgi:phosphoribosylamine--glycine ligase
VKVLVVGSGGREHALAWALARSPRVSAVYVAPGNGGTAGMATNVPIAADDVPGLVAHAAEGAYDLVVVGPEQPLSLGLVDALRERGIVAFGPTRAAARLEWSKAFSKDFMAQHGIPTAAYAAFDDYDAALAYLDEHPAPVWIKADGLAAGKGAIGCRTDDEARQALHQVMVERAFGAAGERVVLEEWLLGQEVSVLAYCDGHTVAPMILAQDHKAAYDGDRGPNTGGMGCYAPAPLLDEALYARVVDEVLQRTVDGMRAAGAPYVGVLYAGLMVHEGDYRVLEFNCRFGDPEAQVILPLMETDIVDVALACAEGRLGEVALRWAAGSCVCVVMAAGGYPGKYRGGDEISGLGEAAALPDTVVFHAGTRAEDGRVVTAGGRVLGVTAWAADLPAAIEQAYAAVERIHWADAGYRRDIGAKGLRRERGGG